MNRTDRARMWRIVVLMAFASGVAFFWRLLVAWIFQPMAWLIWACWRVLASINQGICWAVLVAVCAGLVIRLALGASESDGPKPELHGTEILDGDRLARWEQLASGLEDRRSGSAGFRAKLEPLAFSVAEMTRTPLPPAISKPSGAGPGAWLSRLVPGYRRREEMRAVEELLNTMESALEIKHEPDAG